LSFPRPICHSRVFYVIPAKAGIQKYFFSNRKEKRIDSYFRWKDTHP
jgi:hypothetical protein